MPDLIRRLAWFAVVASISSYAVLLVAGSFVHARAARAYDPVVIRDELGVGVHHLSGMVVVPFNCDQLSMHVEKNSTTTYALEFKTWRDPAVPCDIPDVPRAFREVLFAPSAGIHIQASIDGRSFPVALIPIVGDATP